MRYFVVYEKTDANYAAYVPDLPGCVATGVTLEDTERSIREAIEFHLEGMVEDGTPIPHPYTVAVGEVDVRCPALTKTSLGRSPRL